MAFDLKREWSKINNQGRQQKKNASCLMEDQTVKKID